MSLVLATPFARADIPDAFEGGYRIGTLHCTVRPVKMAFELRCPGSRTRIFFFAERSAGKTVYVSGSGARRERFEFGDERRGTGRFFRANGEALAVRRVAPPP